MVKVPNINAVSDLESAGKRIFNKIHLILESDVDLTKDVEITITDEKRTMGALTLKPDAEIKEFNFAKHTTGAT